MGASVNFRPNIRSPLWSRRQRPSHANVHSTIQRRGKDRKAPLSLWPVDDLKPAGVYEPIAADRLAWRPPLETRSAAVLGGETLITGILRTPLTTPASRSNARGR